MRLLFIAQILLLQIICFGQDLLPGDGRVYNDTEVPRVDLSLTETDLESLLDPNNVWSDDLYKAVFKWTDTEGEEVIDEVGLRLRGNTSRVSAKKSFKIKFKTFDGNEFYGLSDLNLNGEHNDPSVSRSKLAWDFMKQANVPSPRSNHVTLYINNEYFGLYANVEHIDKDYLNVRYQNPNGNLYKMNYGCDFEDKGSNPDNYKFGGSNRVYELKTNKEVDDYSQLAHFIQILNDLSNPDFRCDLEEVFDVDLYLRALAMEVMLGHFDSPAFNQNNGYLYEDPLSGQIKYIPFDLDNTFGIIWGNTDMATKDIYKWHWSNNPLQIYKVMLDIPEYRYQLGYYIDEFVDAFYNVSMNAESIDALRAQLKPHIDLDDYYTYDYNYSSSDFWSSFNFGIGEHVPYGIKEFISIRTSKAKEQLQSINIVPMLSKGTVKLRSSYCFEIKSVAHSSQIVKVHYNINGEIWLESIMSDDGILNDENANDNIFVSTIDLSAGDEVEYYFSAFNSVNNKANLPKCSQQNLSFIVPNNEGLQLSINEVMASNDTYPDEFGDNDDWIELYNPESRATYINLFLSDEEAYPNKWALPNTIIDENGFLLIWADDDDLQGELHTNFKLKKTGESIWLHYFDGNDYVLIDEVSYTNATTDLTFGRYPNGVGPFIELGMPTPNASNVNTTRVFGPKPFQVKLSPNPTSDVLIIESELSNEAIIIIDRNGKIISKYKLDIYGNANLNIEELSQGLYFIKIEQEGIQQFSKFIKT